MKTRTKGILVSVCAAAVAAGAWWCFLARARGVSVGEEAHPQEEDADAAEGGLEDEQEFAGHGARV